MSASTSAIGDVANKLSALLHESVHHRLDPMGADLGAIEELVRSTLALLIASTVTAVDELLDSRQRHPPEEPSFILLVARMRRLDAAFLKNGQREDYAQAYELGQQIDRMILEMTQRGTQLVKGGV